MPRKPNYRFDRQERERQKAAKKAERLAAKQEKTNVNKEETDTSDPSSSDDNEYGIGDLPSPETPRT